MKSERSLGLRTFPIVAVASCGYMLIALQMAGIACQNDDARAPGLVRRDRVHRRWRHSEEQRKREWAGDCGEPLEHGRDRCGRRVEIAVVLAIANFALLRWLKPLKRAEEEK